MKAFIITILITLTVLPASLIVGQTSAVDVLNGVCNNAASKNETPVVCGSASTTNPVYEILRVAIDIISFVIGIASVVVIVVQGLRFILSSGDPQTVSSARTSIIYACIGILLAAMAQLIVVFILDKIGT